MIEMRDEKPADHRPFFILGCSLIAVSISLISAVGLAFLGFLGAGVVFMAIGLANNDKWKSKRESI